MFRPPARSVLAALRGSFVVGNALLLAACADRTPTGTRSAGALRPELSATRPGRYVIGLEPGRELSAELLAAAGGVVVDRADAIGAVAVDVAEPAVLAGAEGVRYIGRGFEFTIEADEGEPVAADPSDAATPAGTDATAASWYASGVQWDMRAIGLTREVWTGSRGGAGANVCVIDSGIDGQHQELSGKVVRDTSFVTTAAVASPAQLDSNGHGTHVASTAAGRGVVAGGVAPDANLMAAKVFAATGATSDLRVLNAIVWCADNGAHAINMSLNGVWIYPPGTDPLADSDLIAYADAVRYATERGVVVVNSAGNRNVRLQVGPGARQITTPGQIPGNLTVGATGPLSRVGAWSYNGATATLPLAAGAWNPFDPQQVWQGVDGKAFYSNWGPHVAVFAPGGRGGVPAGYRNRIVADLSGTRVQQSGSANDNVWAACSRYSTYGGSLDVNGAPGTSAMCRTNPSSVRYAALAGTSMAAPHVAGLAALLYAEIGGERSPENRARVESCIRSTTDDIGPSSIFGGGRVNAARALACIRGG